MNQNCSIGLPLSFFSATSSARMARLVYAAAASHTAQLIRAADKLSDEQRGIVYGCFDQIRQNLVDCRPDVLVVFGTDHYQGFHLDNMPAFCVGIGRATETFGDAGVPVSRYGIHQGLARFIAGHVLESGLDVATSRRLKLDHAFASPLHLVLRQSELPLVPIVVNAIAAPLAPPMRSRLLGQAVGAAIRDFPAECRVAVLGTGGLSHWVPIPDADQAPDGPNAELIEQMISGRNDPDRMLRLLLPRIASMSDANNARVAEDFDREVIAMLSNRRAAELAQRSSGWIQEHGGGGGQEIRTWLAVAGAAGDSAARLLGYAPVVPWLTGIAAMEWDLTA